MAKEVQFDAVQWFEKQSVTPNRTSENAVCFVR